MRFSSFAIACVVAAALGAPESRAESEWYRFFFAPEGVGEADARPDEPISNTNPTVVGSGRLYIYLMYGDPTQRIVSGELELRIEGPAELTGGDMYQHVITEPSSPTGPRWDLAYFQRDDWIGHRSWYYFDANGDGRYAFRNYDDPGQQAGDTHFAAGGQNGNGDFGTTLVGFVDLHSFADGVATLKLAVWQPIVRIDGNGKDWVYFGFGDASTRSSSRNTSAEPDAYVVPLAEPATLVGGLALILATETWRQGSRASARRRVSRA